MKLSEVLPQLTAPFPPAAHKERKLPGGGRWFFVSWQTIRHRLNQVCPEDWECQYSDPVHLGQECVVRCTITICGVSRQAPGSAPVQLLSNEGKDMSRGSPTERATADAFKNGCECFGIGAYLDEQSDDARAFMIKYLQKSGDGRGVKYATENGWMEGNLRSRPTSRDDRPR